MPLSTPDTSLLALPGLRWRMIALIFLATCINYVDRQSISLLFPVLSKELNFTALQYSRVATCLLLAYMISQTVSGKFYDRYGNRIGFTISIIIWSLAAMAHSMIAGLTTFAALSFCLGFGEAGNWPGAAKVVAEWFPIRERALGMAIFNSGAALGSIIAPPLITMLQIQLGWRTTFLCAGFLGFLWLVGWLLFYRPPNEAERAALREGAEPARPSKPIAWGTLLRMRQVWAILVARLLVDPIWWLFVLWLPEYLSKARGLSVKQIGMFAWAPYVAAACGSLFGGWLAGRLVARGYSVNRARKTVIICAACLIPAGILAAFAESAMAALGYIAIVLFGFQMWISNVQTLPSDFFPQGAVGSVAGLGGTAAALGSMAFTLSTGWVVTHFSYAPVLVTAGLLAPIGTVLLFLVSGPIQRVRLPEE